MTQLNIISTSEGHIHKYENLKSKTYIGWRERNQQDATNLMFIIKIYLNMFRASLFPSSGEQECALQHMVFCTGSDGCGCVELGRKLYALWRLLFVTVHTARFPAPHNHSHHKQCRTPHAAVHTLVLLMMGIMMPETCWDKILIINIGLVASCWFLSLHPTFMMDGHKSLKYTISMSLFVPIKNVLRKILIPNYAMIKIPTTYQASECTQQKSTAIRIKDEIKYWEHNGGCWIEAIPVS